LFLVNTYALAAAVFCRPDLIKGRRQWMKCTRGFVWSWLAFVTATFTKSSFEKIAKRVATDVQCFAENSTSTPANLFSIGKGLACENPCLVPSSLSAAHQIQEQLSPILWGSLDAETNTFHSMPIPNLSNMEYFVVILFAMALASTLWINFFTSPQITRNTVFVVLSGSRTGGIRVGIAKIGALLWYGWSYFALLLVVLAVPGVSWVQEMILARYPVAKHTCLVKAWLPWVIGVALVLVKVAFWRRRRETLAKEKACRIRRFNTALRQLQGNTTQVSLLPEHQVQQEVDMEKTEAAEEIAPPQKHRIEIAETRKVSGLMDTCSELKTWWMNPMGSKDEGFPSADEEKALLMEKE